MRRGEREQSRTQPPICAPAEIATIPHRSRTLDVYTPRRETIVWIYGIEEALYWMAGTLHTPATWTMPKASQSRHNWTEWHQRWSRNVDYPRTSLDPASDQSLHFSKEIMAVRVHLRRQRFDVEAKARGAEKRLGKHGTYERTSYRYVARRYTDGTEALWQRIQTRHDHMCLITMLDVLHQLANFPISVIFRSSLNCFEPTRAYVHTARYSMKTPKHCRILMA
jgi:hypothetical protein